VPKSRVRGRALNPAFERMVSRGALVRIRHRFAEGIRVGIEQTGVGVERQEGSVVTQDTLHCLHACAPSDSKARGGGVCG
jgi:hypothetical protein